MKPFTCIAIDDNQDALEIIVRLINKCDYLTLLYAGTDPHKALQFLKEKKIIPDILFLDLKMPNFWGFDFADQNSASLAIYTTAYREFWSDALDKDSTIHYLLKPIFSDKFNIAIAKAIAVLERKKNIDITLLPPETLFIPGNGKEKISIKTKDIEYCIASNNYNYIHMADGRVNMTYLTLKVMEELLPSPWFIRIHRSYFVNATKIIRLDANEVYLSEKLSFPIGSTYNLDLSEIPQW